MTKKHDAIFDDVLSGLDQPSEPKTEKERNRFLKRGTALGDKLSGSYEEKTLHWVDPKTCRMWAHHNRSYELLTPENTADLIDGIRAQGQQEFPAIVRKIDDPDYQYEVIAGARRHYAVSWLRENNYPQFKYLIEVRELTDEEAFRLADIENRDREDISDFERARDYAKAIDLYYGGKQKAMAERLLVSQAWLSRYLFLAKLPGEIVAAFASPQEIKERSIRDLKPLLAHPRTRDKLIEKAQEIRDKQASLKQEGQPLMDAQKVMSALKSATRKPAKPKAKPKDDKPSKRIHFQETGNYADFREDGLVYHIEIPSRTTPEEFLRMAQEIALIMKK